MSGTTAMPICDDRVPPPALCHVGVDLMVKKWIYVMCPWRNSAHQELNILEISRANHSSLATPLLSWTVMNQRRFQRKQGLSPYEDFLSRYGISIIKIRRSWDRLIYITGIHILVKRRPYIEGVPRAPVELQKLLIKFNHQFLLHDISLLKVKNISLRLTGLHVVSSVLWNQCPSRCDACCE